jgi:hypothetical protein
MKTKLFIWVLLVSIIGASCKKTKPANDPPEPIKSIVLPYLDMHLVSPCYALPDNSLVLTGAYRNSSNIHLLKFNKDLSLVDSAILSKVSLDRFDNIVRGDKFYIKTNNAFFEINSNLETVQVNPKIEKDMGFDNPANINAAVCIGPDDIILFAANGMIGGVNKFVLAAYGQDITKPLWVVDTLPMGEGPDYVTSIGYFHNNLFVWGSKVINSSTVKNYRKIFQWGGTVVFEELLESQFLGVYYFRILDSNLYVQPGISLVLNDNTTKFTGIYADQIFQNSLNGYTVFNSITGAQDNGYIWNLSKDFHVLKKYEIAYDGSYNQVFGPAGPDTWIFGATFYDENRKFNIRLTKLNKDLE